MHASLGFAPCGSPGLLSRSGSSFVEAATIRQFELEHDQGCYRLSSITHLDAVPDSVFAVLTDYDEFERISDL